MVRCLFLLLLLSMTISSSAQLPPGDSIINAKACKQIVEMLAADSFLGRFTGSEKGEQAARYIANEFRKAGCAPGGPESSFFIPFPFYWKGDSMQANNVAAILPGKSKPHQWIIFSAHYDHVGTKSTNMMALYMPELGKPEKNDTIYNGANDNASGVSALILLARYFAKANNNERTLVFLAFSGEELGLLGSQQASLLMNHDSIMAMINMDMLGVPISRRNKNPVITGSGYSDLQIILNNRLNEKLPGEFDKNYFRNDPFKSENLFRRSDNYWFALRGVPAHTIIATHPRNKFYHSLNDEPATLDYELLAKNIKAVAIGSGSLSDGTQTPSRINPLKINE